MKEKEFNWKQKVITAFKEKNDILLEIWNQQVEEEREMDGEDFDISQVYPPKPVEIIFEPPKPGCKEDIKKVEQIFGVKLFEGYKDFVCTEGSIVIKSAFDMTHFSLWAPDEILLNSRSALKVFIDRYKELEYDIYRDQIPFLEKSVVFATSWLRGGDEYDHFLFTSSKSKENTLFRVEIKEGLSALKTETFANFLLDIASAIDVEELSI